MYLRILTHEGDEIMDREGELAYPVQEIAIAGNLG